MTRRARRVLAFSALGVAAALPLVLYLWGFLVDDAFITARYAANIAAGHGYRYNPGGPSTDGVTPLGFALLLAPYATDGAMGAFRAAKLLGAITWLTASAMIAVAIDSIEGSRAKWLGLALAATSTPLAAWAVAGMETGIVIGLAGIAAASRVLGRERTCCVAAAVVAAWRPEAIPWAVTLALTPPRRAGLALTSRWIKLALVTAPALVVALSRYQFFGHATPLGAIAKPSTLRLGGMYALACAILCGAIAIVAWRDVPNWARGLQLAVVAHGCAIAVAGGDWMPVSRLATTALPTLALAAAAIAARPPRGLLDRAAWAARASLALGGQLFVLVNHGPTLARTETTRMRVLESLGPELRAAGTVAALDIGWIGVSTTATVVDLAGVTDPEVAVLEGGHTSKRIPAWWLDARGVDTLVVRLRSGARLQSPWYTSRFATFVDAWLATTPDIAEDFEVVVEHRDEPHYVLLRRKRPLAE